jgi:serine protease
LLNREIVLPGGFPPCADTQRATPEQVVEILCENEAIEYAERNYCAAATFVPDDGYSSFQWNLDNPVTGGIQMEAAWDIQRGDPNVVVAVLDTGIAYEDFGVFRKTPDFGSTLFVPGYDFVSDDDHSNDDQGHGTHVGGTITASTDNRIGIAGVAFGCSLMPVKVLDEHGIGDHFTIAEGIFFAADSGARVINMSLSSPNQSRTLRDAVATAYQRGVTSSGLLATTSSTATGPAIPRRTTSTALRLARCAMT